jgi:septal ring factor EnvC (AmiA/AmiB activator)
MWNMMCDVMPTISEDSISQRSSQFSGEDANFEQLMVSMLDERDKLMDSLRETQERLGETEMKLADVEKERDSLQRQIAANLPQVRRARRVTSRARVRRVTPFRRALCPLCTDLELYRFLPAKLKRHFHKEIPHFLTIIY